MTRRRLIKSATIGVLALGAFPALAWWQFTRPHVYRSAVSPDGSWSLTVLRQRVCPYVEGVSVIAEIRDNAGHLLRREEIGSEDIWIDVDDKYPAVECSNDTARVSRPDHWPDGKDWVVRKSDLLTRNPG